MYVSPSSGRKEPSMADDRDDRKNRWQGFDLGGGPGGTRRWRFTFLYVLLGFVLLAVVNQALFGASQEIAYSEFLERVENEAVARVAISETSVTGELRGSGETFTATRPPIEDPDLDEFLTEHNVEFTGEQPSGLTTFLFSWILPILILVAIWGFVFRRMAGGGAASALNLGKRGVKIYDRKDLKTTFSDVAGVDEAVEELREIVAFLENPKKYQRLGGRIPKGVLLLGPPGCGKTLLARAVAGEAKVPFFFMSGSEFVEMFVGLGAARVRELFQQAKDRAPCLVFLDELDTIGKTRAGALGAGMGSHDEREQTLNQLLVEMDGFDASKGVIIMAATNRPDVLDPALLRPGRFDRQVVVDRPDLRGREDILKVHARGVALAQGVDLQVIAARTPGFTGADLANVVNEAALLAARREKDAVGMAELEEAIDRVSVGLERKSRVMSDREREITAVHEMGHALVALAVPDADPLHRVTIIPRGMAALGVTMLRPLEDRYISTEPQLRNMMAFAMGGRAAEEVLFGQASSGAHNDLENATRVARMMVAELGMSDKLGPVSFGRDGMRGMDGQVMFPTGRPDISEETAKIIDGEVARILKEEFDRALGIIEKRKDLLGGLSKLLMVRETLEGDELKAFVEGSKPIPDPEEERKRLEAEHEAREAKARAAEERARRNDHREGDTEQLEPIPPPPHAKGSTEKLRPR
jgi:cell division protease FtsH